MAGTDRAFELALLLVDRLDKLGAIVTYLADSVAVLFDDGGESTAEGRGGQYLRTRQGTLDSRVRVLEGLVGRLELEDLVAKLRPLLLDAAPSDPDDVVLSEGNEELEHGDLALCLLAQLECGQVLLVCRLPRFLDLELGFDGVDFLMAGIARQ